MKPTKAQEEKFWKWCGIVKNESNVNWANGLLAEQVENNMP